MTLHFSRKDLASSALCLGIATLFAAPGLAQTGQLYGLEDNCLDVFQANSDNATPVVMWQCTGNPNQDWEVVESEGLTEIRGLGGKCLVLGDVGASGHRELEIGACGAAGAKWRSSSDFGTVLDLIHNESGLCADVLNSGTSNGTPVIGFPCAFQSNQVWRLIQQREVPSFLLPFTEFDRSFLGVATFFSVRNPAPYAVSVDIGYFTDTEGPGSASHVDRARLRPGESRSFNLDTIYDVEPGFGWVGITTIDEFTGLPFAAQDLYGDFFRVDYAGNFAIGDRLLAADDALCTTWHSRFLSGGDFNGGTKLRFFVPQFNGETWAATGRVFDEQGNLVQPLLPITSDRRTLSVSVDSFGLTTSFGTIEWTFDDGVKGQIAVAMDALGRFSVGYEATCRD